MLQSRDFRTMKNEQNVQILHGICPKNTFSPFAVVFCEQVFVILRLFLRYRRLSGLLPSSPR